MDTSAVKLVHRLPPPPEETSAKERPQPLFLKLVPEYKDILKQIQDLSPEKFDKKAIYDLIRITPSSVNHFRLIQRFLTESKFQFFAMRPKAERPKKVVIRVSHLIRTSKKLKQS